MLRVTVAPGPVGLMLGDRLPKEGVTITQLNPVEGEPNPLIAAGVLVGMVLTKFNEENTLVMSQADIYGLFGTHRDVSRTLYFLEWEVAVRIEEGDAGLELDSLRVVDGMKASRYQEGGQCLDDDDDDKDDEDEDEDVEDFVGGFVGGGGLSQLPGAVRKGVCDEDSGGVSGAVKEEDSQAKATQANALASNGTQEQEDGQQEQQLLQQHTQQQQDLFPLGLVGQHGEASDDSDMDEEGMNELRLLKVHKEQQRQLEQAEGEFRVKINTDILQAALMSSQQAELEETLWADYDKDPKGGTVDEPEEEGEWGADAEYGEDVAL